MNDEVDSDGEEEPRVFEKCREESKQRDRVVQKKARACSVEATEKHAFKCCSLPSTSDTRWHSRLWTTKRGCRGSCLCLSAQELLELNTVHKELKHVEAEDLWITIDSGASENVIAESMAPQCKVKPSQGSREGVRYVAANGETMANKWEKDIKVVTDEGHKCLLKMQVADGKKPLRSVARICDASHRVVFTRKGGWTMFTA